MSLRETLISKPWAVVKQQRILKDRFLRWFIAIAIILFVLEWSLLGFRLRPTGFVVPFEYTSGTEFRFGSWWLIYSYGIFSLLVTFGNIVLASVSYEKSRITSFFLVLSAVVVNIFILVITYTLLAQVS